MCGRYRQNRAYEIIRQYFRTQGAALNLQPRWNIAPTQDAPVVRLGPTGRQISMLRWGFIPAWAKDAATAFKMINARAETVDAKPAYREAFHKRRCLIVADGFYEWRQEGKVKQPYLFERTDGTPMAFAGLWERWSKGTAPIESFTIIVTDANEDMRPLHDRMPVILDPPDFDTWLDTTKDPGAAKTLLKHYGGSLLSIRPVSRRLNNPANDDPSLDQPD